MSLAFYRWRINDLKRELDAIGCHVPLEPHGQGYKDMSPAVDIVERLVIQRKLRARVSARDQDLASQDAELRAASRRLRQGVQGEGLGRQGRPARAREAPAQEAAQRRARAPRWTGALNAGPPQHPRRHRRGRGELSSWLTPGRTPRSRSFL